MIYKKLNLPITDSLRFHYPIKYRHPNKVPVQVSITDHTVEIKAFIDFAPELLAPYKNLKNDKPDPFLLSKGENFTFADAICEGINKNWSGEYCFPWYAYEKESKFKVIVNIIRKDDPESDYDPKQRFARIRFAPFFSPSSFVVSGAWRWFWGIFYSGSLESFSLNWNPRFPGTIYLKPYKHLTRFEQVAAHEFGHLLGIGDAYDAPYRFFYQLDGVSSYMMCYNRKVQNEELEMVLRAHLTKRMQYFPYKVRPGVFFKGLLDHFKK